MRTVVNSVFIVNLLSYRKLGKAPVETRSFFCLMVFKRSWFISNTEILRKRGLFVLLQKIGENSDTFGFQTLRVIWDEERWSTLKSLANVFVDKLSSSSMPGRQNVMLDFFMYITRFELFGPSLNLVFADCLLKVGWDLEMAIPICTNWNERILFLKTK